MKRIGLSKLQEIWLHDRYVEGRNVAVVVGVPEGGVILRHLDWEKSRTPAAFSQSVIGISAISQWIVQETQK